MFRLAASLSGDPGAAAAAALNAAKFLDTTSWTAGLCVLKFLLGPIPFPEFAYPNGPVRAWLKVSFALEVPTLYNCSAMRGECLTFATIGTFGTGPTALALARDAEDGLIAAVVAFTLALGVKPISFVLGDDVVLVELG